MEAIYAADVAAGQQMAQYTQDLVQHAIDDSMKPNALLRLEACCAASAPEAADRADAAGAHTSTHQNVPAGRWIRRLMAMLPQQISRYAHSGHRWSPECNLAGA